MENIYMNSKNNNDEWDVDEIDPLTGIIHPNMKLNTGNNYTNDSFPDNDQNQKDNDYNDFDEEYRENNSIAMVDMFDKIEEDENGTDYQEDEVKEEFKGEFFQYDYCVKCELKNDWEHNCEYIPEYPDYEKEEKENCPFKKYRFEIIKCGDNNVTDGISNSYKRWQPEIPVFISSQTGKGKNFFVENTLLPFIRKLNQEQITQNKILILSNRIALRSQMRSRLDETERTGFAKVYSYQSLLDKIDDLEKQQQYEDSKFSYVICDEAHFFISDSMFNPYTYEILCAIVNTFQNAIRIYMTATPEECLNYICSKENIIKYNKLTEYEDNYKKDRELKEMALDDDQFETVKEYFAYFLDVQTAEDGDGDLIMTNDKKFEKTARGKGDYKYVDIEDSDQHFYNEYKRQANRFMYYYKFNRNFDYLHIKYYRQHEELINEIAESANREKTSEKWIIFIDDKKQCEDFKNILISKDKTGKSIYGFKEEDILVINAEIKKYEKSKNANERKKYEEYKDMIINEKFDRKILISTSVIDNGFNLKDRQLKNIVVSDINKAKCLQMVGRVRNVNENTKIILYLKIFDENDLTKKIDDLEKQKDAYYNWDIAYSKGLFDSSVNYERKVFNDKYYNGELWDFEDAKHWFGRYRYSAETVYPNNITRSLVNNTLTPRYESILKEMQARGNQIYLDYQLRRWFNKTYVEENDILENNKKKKDKLIEFLESWVDKRIYENNKMNFRKTFTDLSISAFRERKHDSKKRIANGYSSSIIRKIFEENHLPYIINVQGYDYYKDDKGKIIHAKNYWSINKKSDNSK